MENTTKPYYSFAAMNTADGFRGYFKEIFGSADVLYIIKGGPGTGKSRFMKELGICAEQNGQMAEYFLCSSDPTSLDGVIFTDDAGKKTAVIDGTSPHAYEPTAAGLKEHILNFGDFWDTNLLQAHKTELEALSTAKKRLYSSFYAYLKAVSSLDSIVTEISHRAIDRKKLTEAVGRLLRGIPKGSRYTETLRIRGAVSCDGAVTLESCFGKARNRYAVMDVFFTAEAFMSTLKSELSAKGTEVVISYSPYSPTVPDAVYIPSTDTAFYVGCNGSEGEKTVNMRRFLLPERITPYKTKLREIFKLRDRLLSLLSADGSSIRRLHEEIESIYGIAMDFGRKEEFTRELCQKLFGTN